MEHPSYEMRRRQLLARLVRQKNGAVVDAMEALEGGKRLFSYGVSLPTLKTIVRSYPADNDFADYLFHTDVRELKLAAVYLADGPGMTAGRMEAWKSAFVTFEIAVNCASALFWQSPDAYATAVRWLEADPDPVTVRAAFIMLARGVANDRIAADVRSCDELLRVSANRFFPDRTTVAEGIGNLFERLVRKNGENRERIVRFLRQKEREGSAMAAALLEEVAYW